MKHRHVFSIAGVLTLVTVLAITPARISAIPEPGGAGGQIQKSVCTAPGAPPVGLAGTLTIGSVTAQATVAGVLPPSFTLATGAPQPKTSKGMGPATATFAAPQGNCVTTWTYVRPTYSVSTVGAPTITFTNVEALTHASVPSPTATTAPGGAPHP